MLCQPELIGIRRDFLLQDRDPRVHPPPPFFWFDQRGIEGYDAQPGACWLCEEDFICDYGLMRCFRNVDVFYDL